MMRVGPAITRDAFAGMVEPSSKVRALSKRALFFDAPRHVLSAFEAPGEALLHRTAVYATEDGLENVMVMTIQRHGVLLPCILPLSDARVQGFVADCIELQSIRLVLALQDMTRFAVLELDSPFGEEDRLN